jgi:sec-independent protein translocase protein TatA
MFNNIGVTEILIFALILLLLFGGKKVSQLAKGAGQAGKELKNIGKEIKNVKKDISKDE